MISAMCAHWISYIFLLFGTNSFGIRGEHHCAPEEVELRMTDDMFGPSNMAELQQLFTNCVEGGCKVETTIYSTRDFSGEYCNHHPNTCRSEGKCLNYDTHPYYTCNCTDGNYGKNCSQKYCEHHPNSCQHNGTCLNINTHPYHTCNCTDGNYGKNCSQNFCEHHPNVCQHNGTCLKNDTQPYHTCNCTDRYYGKNCSRLVRSCEDAKSELARNDSGGVYKLDIPEVGITNVFCDVTDDGGNWTVFQRRMNGDVDFYRGWNDYVKGFGDLQGDHWLGLEALHQLTKTGNMEMKIKMIKKDGDYWVAKYSNFRIGSGSDKYRLNVSGYSGNATIDALAHNNRKFTAYDADHDSKWSGNCASLYEGGWWYGECGRSNLNGNFNKTGSKGIWWCWWWHFGDQGLPYHSHYNLLRFSEMKFRKRL